MRFRRHGLRTGRSVRGDRVCCRDSRSGRLIRQLRQDPVGEPGIRDRLLPLGDRAIDDQRSVVRFESTSGEGFVAEITYDGDGLVVDYPGIGTRMG